MTLLDRIETRRQEVSARLAADGGQRSGQVFTPTLVAQRIAAQLSLPITECLTILDPGAGMGSLSAALVDRLIRDGTSQSINVTAVESDSRLTDSLRATLEDCRQSAANHDIRLTYSIATDDFIRWASEQAAIDLDLFNRPQRFNVVIQNPPYGKSGRSSPERHYLSRLGVAIPNLYAAFVLLGARLLTNSGQMVAIIPRSFANGRYFRQFRQALLDTVCIDRIATFHDRDALFADSAVLQETIILTVTRDSEPSAITIETSRGYKDPSIERRVPSSNVVRPDDPEMFIHIPTDADDKDIAELFSLLPCRLSDLGVEVSTGRVVDFRATEYLSFSPGANTVPLIYPGNLHDGSVQWPLATSRKPSALLDEPGAQNLLLPSGTYVLVKRFSAKEETRRVVASVFMPQDVPSAKVGFENHLNVFHTSNAGLDNDLARGLALWLNSTVLDLHFRQFSGHTQVNATDLRNLRYPSREQLATLGGRLGDRPWPDQNTIDELVTAHLAQPRADGGEASMNGDVETRMQEAKDLLRSLNFDAERRNERSALVLLALLKLTPSQAWSEASNPLLRTVDIMDFIRQHYGRDYKPNTRETIRRQTLHQFAEVALVLQNPDRPDRPINSPKWSYQMNPIILNVIRQYGSVQFDPGLRAYLAESPGLLDRYAAERKLRRIPVRLPNGDEVSLSPGGQNELLRAMIQDFCAYFTPGGVVLYVGDADDKWQYFEREQFDRLGIHLDEHGKMPDLVVYLPNKDWLVLLEAASSHGPVDAKRHGELRNLFAAKADSLVFVSCFPTREEMRKDLAKIAWETEVWCADARTHLIHFNGERFLGPHVAQDV